MRLNLPVMDELSRCCNLFRSTISGSHTYDEAVRAFTTWVQRRTIRPEFPTGLP